MKSLIAFSLVLLDEIGKRCGVSTTHDRKTIVSRVEREGESFLTITLAKFGKDLQKGLDLGFVDHTLFNAFAFQRGLPRFLGGFLDRVFDRGTGRLLDAPDKEAIRCMLQLTLAFAKLKEPCSDERVSAAFSRYVECEQEIREAHASISEDLFSDFERIGSLLFRDLFTWMDARIHSGEVLPKHGSGSTADGIRGNAKYRLNYWTDRLEEVFHASEFLYPTYSSYLESPPNFLEPGSEIPVKVITVPKTLTTPRIIAMEPVAVQYAQQGLLEIFQEGHRRFDNARSFICSDSQEPNRELARIGSKDGSFATLDLSEASDRVTNQQVRRLVRRWPWLAKALDATRSRKADVPGYGVIRLAKFASMGSAVCFPVEAMVFATIVFLGIEQTLNRRLTTKDVVSLRGRVRIYGDDIIVPVDMARSVVNALASFGMRVNVGKSFWTGKFRESCGGEYYDGFDVSYVKVRQRFPSQLKHVTEIQSTVALRNLLFDRGFDETVAWIDEILEGVLPVFPVVPRHSQALGRWSWEPAQADKLHPSLHIPVVKACVVKATLPEDILDGYGALMKWYLKRSNDPFEDRFHLLRAGRPVSVRIKTQWVSAV